MIRVTNNMVFDSITSQLNKQQGRLAATQEKITTGRNFIKPSDAPDQVAALDRLESSVRRTERYIQNLADINNKLELHELAINAIDRDLIRAKQLLVQGSNGTLDEANRESIAIELQTIYNNMVAVGNWKDAYGSYLFSGALQEAPPFDLVKDPLSTGFSDFYGGNDHIQKIAVDEGFHLEVGIPGARLFAGFESSGGGQTDIFTSLKKAINALGSNDTAGIGAAIDDVDNALTHVNIRLNQVGAKMGSAATQQSFLDNRSKVLETLISQIEDLDYISAVTELKNQTLALQAGQSSFSMISSLSLFNYIK